MKSLINRLLGKKETKRINDLIPKGISHTIVPKSFEESFPVWEKPKGEVIYVN